VDAPPIVAARRRVLDPAAGRRQAADSKARQRTRRRLFGYFLDNGFADDDELAFFLDEFLGLQYPRQASCPHHVAPFQILSDLYFDRVRAMLIYASRASGKTLMFAVMNLLDGCFRAEPIDITNAAATRDQAVKCYRYFTGFHKDPLLAGLLAKEPTQSYSEYKTGSTVKIVTGCVAGDTVIDLPGRKEFIRDLVGRADFLAYAFDTERLQFTLTSVKRVWRTAQQAPVVKVTVDRSAPIVCTPDHRFLVWDDGRRGYQTSVHWVAAADLRPGDTLVPLHRIIDLDTGNWRWVVSQPQDGIKAQFEHRWMGELLWGDVEGYHVHHVDEDPLNNDPPNLERLPPGVHASITNLGRKFSAAKRAAQSACMRAMYAADAERRRVSPQLGHASRWIRAGRTEAARDLLRRINAGPFITGALGYPSVEDWIASRNHKVVRVEPYPATDVYDMEVEGHHTFVANGVVLHNSSTGVDSRHRRSRTSTRSSCCRTRP
jgi:Intein splicing domain/HNH endonuclease